MLQTTTLLTFVSTLLAGSALAAPLESRDTCQHVYEPNLWSINSQSIYGTYGPQTTFIQIYRGSGPTNGFTDVLVEFNNIPANSYGCELQFDYQPGHGAYVTSQQGNAAQINVHALTGPVPAYPTWQNVAPITGSLVGTFNFPTGNDLNSPHLITIDSFVCHPTMRFRLSMNDQALGLVCDTEDASSGLRIAHNC